MNKFSIVQINAKSGTIGEVGDSWYVEDPEGIQDHEPDFESIFPGDTVTVYNTQRSLLRTQNWFTTEPVTEVLEVESDKVCFRCSDGALYFLYQLH